jgi:hypothetical protein
VSASVWRLVGASQLALGLGHVALWRLFGWSRELTAVSALTARVFAIHTFFIAFLLVALGALEVLHPELLENRSELGRLLLATVTVFWTLRLLAQPLVFDPVLLRGSRFRTPVRFAATALFAGYVLVYALALGRQLG